MSPRNLLSLVVIFAILCVTFSFKQISAPNKKLFSQHVLQDTNNRASVKVDGPKFAKSFVSQYFMRKPSEEEYSIEIAPKKRLMSLFSSPRTVYFTNPDVTTQETENGRLRRKELKSKLFAISASCDRGFSAISSERKEIEALIKQLTPLSTEKNPTRNLYPFNQNVLDRAPLEAAWKMVYTSSPDVLSVASNPLTQVQGVYQLVYRDGSAVNIVNLAPRIQSLLPSSLIGDGSIVRLKVFTKAIARNETRLGISFRRVELKPIKLMNRDVAEFLPPLRATIPQVALFGADRSEPGLLYEKNTPGYFDVLYLDEDTLVIQQDNGGIFVGIRSPEPIDSFLK